MEQSTGGGQKINILRENLARYKDDKEKVILFTDSYDVILTQTPDFLLNKFETFKSARIIFGAEDFCWPDKALQVKFLFPARRSLCY
jgi:procollagen-lysine,2-oxoglutarate 5-dioxygenase, invertebrate